MRETDLEVLQKGKPYIRSILAFLLFLRFGGAQEDIKPVYAFADDFLNQLEEDVKNVTTT